MVTERAYCGRAFGVEVRLAREAAFFGAGGAGTRRARAWTCSTEPLRWTRELGAACENLVLARAAGRQAPALFSRFAFASGQATLSRTTLANAPRTASGVAARRRRLCRPAPGTR